MGKKSRKEKKRVDRGTNRLDPVTPEYASMLDDVEKLGVNNGKNPWPKVSSEYRKTFEERRAAVNSFETEWERKRVELYEHWNAANFNFSEYHKVNQLATTLLNEMYETLESLGMRPRNHQEAQDESIGQYASDTLLVTHRLRSCARLELGLYEGSVQDATEGLSLVRILAAACGDTAGHPEALKSQKEEIALLLSRGRSLRALKKLDEAHVDLRAACAAFRIKKECWPGWPAYPDAVKELAINMALQKVREGIPRPHYTQKERDSFMREHGLGPFTVDKYKCLQCGVSPSPNKPGLALCSGCRDSWFCGRECQAKCWKTGHKQDCKKAKLSVLHMLFGDDRASVEKIVAESGFFALQNGNEPVIIVQDPVSGDLFDSLRDEKLTFPSEHEERLGDEKTTTIVTHVQGGALMAELAMLYQSGVTLR